MLLLSFLVVVYNGLSYSDGKRIIGGDYATLGQIPYQASLQQNRRHFCGGSLISEQFILTAAHCVWNRPADQTKVVLGLIDLQRIENASIFDIGEFIMHPLYKGNSFDYDIALIKLSRIVPIDAHPNIDAIKVIDGNATYAANTLATVSGFGAINRNLELPNRLKYAIIQMWSRSYCNERYYPQVTSRMLCAGSIDGQMGSCPGDSGGPLTVANKLVGIVSWGFGCGTSRLPGIYTYVGIFYNWIQQNIH